MSTKRIVNVAELELSEAGDGGVFVARLGKAGPLLGSKGLGCTLTVLPPGKRAFPFHRHHVIHEMFYVLSVAGETRIGEERFAIKPGDLIAAPAGTEPHQIVNTGAEELRFLAFSTIGEVDVVEYPDSGKVAAAAGIKDANFATATFKGLGRLHPAGYYDGEQPK